MEGRFPYSVLTCSHSSITTSWTEEAREEGEGTLAEPPLPRARGDSVDEPLIARSSSVLSDVMFLNLVRNFSRLSLNLFLHRCRERERERERERLRLISGQLNGSREPLCMLLSSEDCCCSCAGTFYTPVSLLAAEEAEETHTRC